jgi:catechol 2,3-dioxygenase-like lactoylglutathione lyase family enzyme
LPRGIGTIWLPSSSEIPAMNNKIVFFLWLVAAGLLSSLPAGARAATLGDGDYARIGVPDLQQASAFFHDVLNCHPVGDPAPIAAGASGSRLLSCGSGSMLELFVERGHSPARGSAATGETLQFLADGTLRTDAWLRQRGVIVSGAPHRLTSGPWAGRMALDFVAPWGMRMRLLGSKPPDTAYGDIDTVAAAPRGH